MFVFLMLGVPIFICLFAAAFVGSLLIGGPIYTLQQFASGPYHITSSYTFAVVPLFVLMSTLAVNCGIAQNAYDAARKWLGGFRGAFNGYCRSGRHFRGCMRLKYSHVGGICQDGVTRTQEI
jgi:TRAP-type mannitol/chloroaromatic compound transport system permease large subunit